MTVLAAIVPDGQGGYLWIDYCWGDSDMYILDRIAVRHWLRGKPEAGPLFLRPLKMHRLLSQVDDMAVETMSDEEVQAQMAAAQVGASGNILAQLLAFLDKHWADILALIEALLKVH